MQDVNQENNQPPSQDTVSANNATKSHLKDRSAWMRILYMLLFIVLYSVAEVVLSAVVFLQVLFRLFTGKVNERLLSFGADTSRYIYDTLRFLTFNCEDMPFPFSDWKKGD